MFSSPNARISYHCTPVVDPRGSPTTDRGRAFGGRQAVALLRKACDGADLLPRLHVDDGHLFALEFRQRQEVSVAGQALDQFHVHVLEKRQDGDCLHVEALRGFGGGRELVFRRPPFLVVPGNGLGIRTLGGQGLTVNEERVI